jgi:hypothetical protein
MASPDWAPHYIDRPVDHADDCASVKNTEGVRPSVLALQSLIKLHRQSYATATYHGTKKPFPPPRYTNLRLLEDLKMYTARLTSMLKQRSRNSSRERKT